MENAERKLVKQIGDLIGYETLMNLASDLWLDATIEYKCPASEVFIPVLPADIKDEQKDFYLERQKNNLTLKAHWNLTVKKGKSEYSPTIKEIQDEISKLKGEPK